MIRRRIAIARSRRHSGCRSHLVEADLNCARWAEIPLGYPPARWRDEDAPIGLKLTISCGKHVDETPFPVQKVDAGRGKIPRRKGAMRRCKTERIAKTDVRRVDVHGHGLAAGTDEPNDFGSYLLTGGHT